MPMIQHWVDGMASVAYVAVSGHVTSLADMLEHVDSLIRDPRWRPGMPIIEDLRHLRGGAPPAWQGPWRRFLIDNAAALVGCPWAIVLAGEAPSLMRELDEAADIASGYGVVLRTFTDTAHAHAWVNSVGRQLVHIRPGGLPDRRAKRFELPPCRRCGSPAVRVHDRTEDALILDCMACEDRWLVPKPPRPSR
jgi:hypothetical protein